MRLLFFVTAFYCLMAGPVGAAIFYVDYKGGTDTADGKSAATAWKHCPGDPAAVDQAAACALAPGDTVYFKGGVTYVFTGSAGIALAWDGAPGQAITYDGNSSGAWGSGRAKFTDQNGGAAITAFTAAAPRQHLVFKHLQIERMGGAEALPSDPGAPLAARFGGGIAFQADATEITIQDCKFRELGYWFARRPMSAASIAGVAISSRTSRGFSVAGCEFSRLAIGCDFSGAGALERVELSDCAFRESVVTPLELPASGAQGLSIHDCDLEEPKDFDFSAWSGYGDSPRVRMVWVGLNEHFTLSASAIASPAPSFQWHRNGMALPGATGATLTLSSTSIGDSGIYSVVASNANGSSSSNSIVLVVTPYASLLKPVTGSNPVVTGPSVPVITAQPVAKTVVAPAPVTLSVAADGAGLGFEWRKDGVAIPGATTSTLSLATTSAASAGNYSVRVTNATGAVESATAVVTVQVRPQVSVQPAHQIVTALTTATMTASASGAPAPTVQWLKNGVMLPGATQSTLTLVSVTTNDAASYTAVATNAAGSAESNGSTVVVAEPRPPTEPPANPPPVITDGPTKRLLTVGADPATFTFTIEGSAMRKVLVRAVGPSLTTLGFQAVLSDPSLSVYSGSTLISQNDNWGGLPFFRDAFSAAGAFPLSDAASKDAVVFTALPPGVYQAVVTGVQGATGTVLVEVITVP